jgi:hypothetical protein
VKAALRVLALAVLAGCLLSTVRADDTTASNPLDDLAPFVGGSWVGKGKHGTDDFRTRVVYEWGLNRRLVKAKSYLKTDKGEQLVYESVFTYHPGKKKVVFLSVAADGHIFDGTLRKDGDAYESQFDSLSQDKTATYRQTIRFVDKDHTEWQVYAKKGNDWVKVIDSRQERVRE